MQIRTSQHFKCDHIILRKNCFALFHIEEKHFEIASKHICRHSSQYFDDQLHEYSELQEGLISKAFNNLNKT